MDEIDVDRTTRAILTKLIDSAAGTFTSSYDVEGKMLTEGYPNSMTASYTFNPLGQATSLSYEKNTHCATKCPETWFSDTVVPSIHGETLLQTSTLAKESYTYDKVGRLTQTQEEPTGKGCVTRIYAYDEESNRTSLTTREPGSEGKCATEGGTIERHTYDPANRLTDTGIAYEAFGNTTALPAADAGGHELTSSYYVDGQVASQTQNEKTIDYRYDPAGRAEETETLTKGKPEATVISHYSGPGEALTWTSEEEGKKWARNIPGIDGALDAIQTSSGSTTLQLHDLQGNIVAKAGISETETKLLETYNSTEFGVPNEGKTPPKYAWLGATGISTELSSGIATKGGASYVPQVARNLQTEPIIPPGAFPDGEGETTPYTATVSSAELEATKAIGTQIFAEIEAARQKAVKKKAEEELQKCREEGGCGAEGSGEGGDPCTTSFEEETYQAEGASIAAWATVEWCYGGGKVISARIKNQGHHQNDTGGFWGSLQLGLNARFDYWEERAEWQGGTYYIERTAVFTLEAQKALAVESPIPLIFEYYIYLKFWLNGNGSAEKTAETRCYPERLCP